MTPINELPPYVAPTAHAGGLSGWVCPVCGEANAPWNTACIAGPHRKTVTTNTTNVPLAEDGE